MYIYSKLLFLFLLIIPIASCGRNDEPQNPDDNRPSDSTSDFVGGWKESIGTFVFFNDGYSKLGTSNFGQWTYNDKTNILATTNNGWQFLVTIFTENQWGAIGISSKDATYTFNKVEGTDLIYAIIQGARYINLDGEQTTMPLHTINRQIGRNNTNPYIDAIGGLCNGYIAFFDDKDNDDTTFEYRAYTLETVPVGYWQAGKEYFQPQEEDNGKAVFSNLFSASKCKLEMTSSHKDKNDIIKRTFIFNNTGKQ